MAELLLERLRALAEKEPERIAVRMLRHTARGPEEQSLTMGAWMRAAGAFAMRLADQGVIPGDRVLLCLPNSLGFLQSFLGCMWIGAVPVPLPSLEGWMQSAAFLARLSNVVKHAAPRAIVADARTASFLTNESGVVSARLPVIRPPAGAPPAAAAAPVPLPHHSGAREPAFIQYTSGSTGTPKGVVVTHGNLASHIECLGKAAALTRDDRMVTWLPLYHDMGLIGGVLTPAAYGFLTHLMSPVDFALRPASWPQALSRYAATLTVAPNFAFAVAARKIAERDLANLDLSAMRLALNGGEPVDPATAEAFLQRFRPLGFKDTAYFPVYGLAESTLAVAFPPLQRPVRIDHVRREELISAGQLQPAAGPGPGVLSFLSVGHALAGHDVVIRAPESHQRLEERRLGEICVAGPSISPYYFDHRGFVLERRHELRTGDLGYMADGELFVVDRLKDLVIVAGRSYAPSDVERAAERVKGIRVGRSVAFSVADPERGTEALVVVAEARPGLRRTRPKIEDEVRHAVTGEVGLSPSDVVLVRPGTLARTSSGKLMRKDTRERYLAGALATTLAGGPLSPARISGALKRLAAARMLGR